MNIRNNLLSTEVPVHERVLALRWDNIPQKTVIREEVRGTPVKKRIQRSRARWSALLFETT